MKRKETTNRLAFTNDVKTLNSTLTKSVEQLGPPDPTDVRCAYDATARGCKRKRVDADVPATPANRHGTGNAVVGPAVRRRKLLLPPDYGVALNGYRPGLPTVYEDGDANIF